MANQSALLAQVRADIENYLKKRRELIVNERDLQVSLAVMLRESKHYDEVEVEYMIPIEELMSLANKGKSYPWSNVAAMYVDIVVRKGEQFVPIELKYTTKAIKAPREFKQRFAEKMLNENIQIIKNREASDLVMYNYWKDVRRLELLKHRYSHIAGGIALLITNAKRYWDASKVRTDSSYYPFYTGEGKTVNNGHWSGEPSVQTTHKNFDLDQSYTCHWEDLSSMDIEGGNSEAYDKFRYCLTEV